MSFSGKRLQTEARVLAIFKLIVCLFVIISAGGAVASWLVRLTLDQVAWVRALARDMVLCSWVRHLTLTAPLSTQVYKWVPANLMLGVTLVA